MSLPRVSTNGEHRRAGFDFTLGWRDNIGKFSYDISANFTKFDQLWANNPSESVSDLMNPYKRATQQTGYYGNLYECLGFYKDAQDVYNSVKRLGSYDLTAGDLKYSDFNGDGKIDDSDMVRTGKAVSREVTMVLILNYSTKDSSCQLCSRELPDLICI